MINLTAPFLIVMLLVMVFITIMAFHFYRKALKIECEYEDIFEDFEKKYFETQEENTRYRRVISDLMEAQTLLLTTKEKTDGQSNSENSASKKTS